jgi:DNA-binding transcriptional regulator YhcF (GntR family)
VLFVLEKGRKDSLLEQARSQLLTALHTGRLGAGDRLPSVRQVALRNRINLKTAHSIYQRLGAEGYITLRVGSGAYVSDDIDQSDLEEAYYHSVLRMVKSNLAEAERLKVSPREYLKLVQRLVNRPRSRPARVAVVEYNEEQTNLFAHEISGRTGFVVYPVLLNRLKDPDQSVTRNLEKADFFATTHFHFREVKALTARLGKPLDHQRQEQDLLLLQLRGAAPAPGSHRQQPGAQQRPARGGHRPVGEATAEPDPDAQRGGRARQPDLRRLGHGAR